MDHTNHTPLSRTDLNTQVLQDAPIYDAEDRKIGTISHVHGAGTVTDVVLDVGGFLGIGSKPVLVNVDQLNLMRDVDGNVHGVTSWTKEQLKDLPEHLD